MSKFKWLKNWDRNCLDEGCKGLMKGNDLTCEKKEKEGIQCPPQKEILLDFYLKNPQCLAEIGLKPGMSEEEIRSAFKTNYESILYNLNRHLKATIGSIREHTQDRASHPLEHFLGLHLKINL